MAQSRPARIRRFYAFLPLFFNLAGLFAGILIAILAAL
jgi:hypothetical protein